MAHPRPTSSPSAATFAIPSGSLAISSNLDALLEHDARIRRQTSGISLRSQAEQHTRAKTVAVVAAADLLQAASQHAAATAAAAAAAAAANVDPVTRSLPPPPRGPRRVSSRATICLGDAERGDVSNPTPDSPLEKEDGDCGSGSGGLAGGTGRGVGVGRRILGASNTSPPASPTRVNVNVSTRWSATAAQLNPFINPAPRIVRQQPSWQSFATASSVHPAAASSASVCSAASTSTSTLSAEDHAFHAHVHAIGAGIGSSSGGAGDGGGSGSGKGGSKGGGRGGVRKIKLSKSLTASPDQRFLERPHTAQSVMRAGTPMPTPPSPTRSRSHGSLQKMLSKMWSFSNLGGQTGTTEREREAARRQHQQRRAEAEWGRRIAEGKARGGLFAFGTGRGAPPPPPPAATEQAQEHGLAHGHARHSEAGADTRRTSTKSLFVPYVRT